METNKLGRGAFRYMIFLLLLNAVTLYILYAFVDTDRLLAGPNGANLLRIGALLFVVELMVFVFWNCFLVSGWKIGLVTFCLTFIIAFIAEALGVNFGIVFGNYYYTDLLGPKIVGVPLLVAMAWEPIIYASVLLTDMLIPVDEGRPVSFVRRLPLYLGLSMVGAIATTAWDMMMDPFAVSQNWWVWRDGGYYVPYIKDGVPITNFLGWLGTAFVAQFVCRIVKDYGTRQHQRSVYLSIYGPFCLYLLLFFMAFSMSMITLHRPEVALIGAMCMGPFIMVALCRIIALSKNPAFTGSPVTDDGEMAQSPRPGKGM